MEKPQIDLSNLGSGKPKRPELERPEANLSFQRKITHPKEWVLLLAFLLICTPVFAWEGIIVHTTDSTHMTLEECNDWHKERGFKECGYNFIVAKSGDIEEARGFERQGAHTRGFNQRFLGVAFVGKGRANPKQIANFKKFVMANRAKVGNSIKGHKEFGRTECPGQIMEQLKGAL